MSDARDLEARIRQFCTERDWGQFHSAKNLSMALSVEAAEIMEHFQWLSEQQADHLDAAKLDAVQAELADTYIYLLLLADRLGIDLISAAQTKMDANERKYPVEKAKGNARKYTEL